MRIHNNAPRLSKCRRKCWGDIIVNTLLKKIHYQWSVYSHNVSANYTQLHIYVCFASSLLFFVYMESKQIINRKETCHGFCCRNNTFYICWRKHRFTLESRCQPVGISSRFLFTPPAKQELRIDSLTMKMRAEAKAHCVVVDLLVFLMHCVVFLFYLGKSWLKVFRHLQNIVLKQKIHRNCSMNPAKISIPGWVKIIKGIIMSHES